MYGTLDKGEYPLDKKIQVIENYGEKPGSSYDEQRTREIVVQKLNEFVEKYLVINGKVYEKCNEPKYVINTFGLGHNYGGTGMFIEDSYNENIRKENYFNALQREEAIAYANRVASNRGDTNDIGKFGKFSNIKVYMPEMVKCNPQIEHGNGNPLLNSMDELISGSNNILEAGILTMAYVGSETHKQKDSIDDKIRHCNQISDKQNNNKESIQHDKDSKRKINKIKEKEK